MDPATGRTRDDVAWAVYRNLLILGSRVNESYDASPGHIRAYDVLTGRLVWVFHTIPQEGQPGHETWKWTDGETTEAPTRGAASRSTNSEGGCSRATRLGDR